MRTLVALPLIGPAFLAHSDAAAAGTGRRRAIHTEPGDLVPGYITQGFTFLQRYLQRPDGFGGADEIALWFQAPPNVPQSYSHPLSIYFTSSPQHEFFGVVGRDPAQKLFVAVNRTELIEVNYYDGIWMGKTWATSTAHSLVFSWRTYQVGIRGSRSVGVSLSELSKIASSLSV
ncbi:MAG: hypothetical protein ACRD3J_31155 [Thermoanaerobaculia bacterium]